MNKSSECFTPSVAITKADLPALIGKGGRNMKKCIKNMYDKGCKSPNFTFDVSDSDDSVSIKVNFTEASELELIKKEIGEYLQYYSENKDNFNPIGMSRHKTTTHNRSFQNHTQLYISRENVSALIGEGGKNIKSLLSKINEDLQMDQKVKLHINYEEDIVYMTTSLYDEFATMKDFLNVEKIINTFVDEFTESHTQAL